MKTEIYSDAPDAPGRSCPGCRRPLSPDAAGGLCPSCLLTQGLNETVSTETSPEVLSRSIGNYEFIEEIARGGMGVVWRARQKNLGREVALKLILAGSFASEVDRKRFLAEAEAAAQLNHPNIVPIVEVGELDGIPFYSMKLVPGGSLAEHLTKLSGDAEAAARLMARVARAVHHAHQRGILHRDLKPGNILLGGGGEPMVTDFGLAKRLDQAGELTVSGTMMGTPNYMAPEQAAGRTKEISTATDVFSLGCILYEMLAGEPPFKAENPMETLQRVVEANPIKPRMKNKKISRDLETICLKCLEKDPARRYGSAEALAEDLERWLGNKPVEARRAPVWERSYKWTRRHPAIAAVLIAVGITGGMGLAAFSAQLEQTRAALKQAEAKALAERSARAPVIAPRETMVFDDVPVAVFSPDKERLLYAAGTNAWIRHAATGEVLDTLNGHESFIRIALWSEDGRRIVTVSTCQTQPVWNHPLGAHGDQTIRIWDPESGSQVAVVAPDFAEPIADVALSPDGERIAAASVDGSIGIWQIGVPEPLWMLPAHEATISQIRFSPDGTRLVSASAGRRYMIQGAGNYAMTSWHEAELARVWDVESGDLLVALKNAGKIRVPSSSGKLQPITSSGCFIGISPDQARIITAASAPENSAIWETRSGRKLASLTGHSKAATRVDVSNDGTKIVTAAQDGTARVWDASSGRELVVLQPHPREVTYAAFAPDSRWVVTVANDHRIRVWDIGAGICVAVLKGHQGRVLSVDFSSDSEEIVSLSEDRTVRRWRWTTLEQLSVELAGHDGAIKVISFDPDSERVVTGSADGTARVWKARTGKLTAILDPELPLGKRHWEMLRANGGGAIEDAVFTPDGTRIITASSDPKLRQSRNPIGIFKPALAPAQPLPFTPGRLWNAATGELETALNETDTAFEGVEVSSSGNRLLFRVSKFDRTMEIRPLHARFSTRIGSLQARLWDLDSNSLIPLQGHSEPVVVARFSPEGNRIITADRVRVWIRNRDGTSPIELPGAKGRDWTRFSPDGERVLAEDSEGYVAVWDVATRQTMARMETAGTNLWHAWFGSGQDEIGTLTREGLLRLFDFPSGAVIWESPASGPISGQAKVSPEARWAAAAVGEQTVDLWDLSQRKQVRTIERHVHEITALSFSPNEQWLATGDQSGKVYLWPLRLAEEPTAVQ